MCIRDRDTFVKRSQILKEIRAYLDEKGFLEVDTPILTPFEIGASARPFYTHHNTCLLYTSSFKKLRFVRSIVYIPLYSRNDAYLYFCKLYYNTGRESSQERMDALTSDDDSTILQTEGALTAKGQLPIPISQKD